MTVAKVKAILELKVGKECHIYLFYLSTTTTTTIDNHLNKKGKERKEEMKSLFTRKSKKDGKGGQDSAGGGNDASENDFLQSLPAKASKRYSMAYSSFSPQGGNSSSSTSYKSNIQQHDSSHMNGNSSVKLVDDVCIQKI
ncbi:hypothetical protein DFA_11179 [Cavenderia fasciculata]|uniref:Uncharacterized protein n=1 Tax=Cavenderia fasciculata TaxID=261658 RepID=F4QFB1_CACFS|nr:uncharacterized protein DFA_11179 [Cavenderia fasciculata]EGG13418.1 hypothetical protein DFA_11179 [Cavenderia fasciculata]|eukprot:XP_004350122.1 hypothetical protein DFA_11179 [Cavenderia fasciculata]